MTALEIIFALGFMGIGIAGLKIMSKNKTAEQKAAIRAANDMAYAYAALRDDDIERFNAQVKALREEIALKDALIEQKEQELARWNLFAQATPANGVRGVLR